MSVEVDVSQALIGKESAEKPFIRIERSKVSLIKKGSQLVTKCLPLVTGWQLLCIYVIVLGLISFSLVLYLKLIGEIMPFCLYDNWFYLPYYILLSLWSAALIPLTDLEWFPVDHRFWCWSRRLGAYIWFIELEGFVYFVLFFKDIAYEVEFDDEAQLLVWTLGSIGIIRFITISSMAWIGNDWLKRLQQKHKLSAKHFGSNFTDVMDILVSQMIAMSLFFYPFNVYNIGFCLSIAYLYFSFART